MHKRHLFSLHPSALILLFLLLAACAPATPTSRSPMLTPTLPAPPATLTGDATIAWQALAEEYDQLFDFWLYAQCPHEQGLFVAPVTAPEWTVVFPDTSLFRGGPGLRHLPGHLELGRPECGGGAAGPGLSVTCQQRHVRLHQRQ
jgi:hypothetical protein